MLLLLASLGCSPTCEQTCNKLLECEDISAPSMSIDECASSCSAQQNVYEDWEDEAKQDAFDSLKSCIVDEECTDVSEGFCYDPDVYVW